MNCILIENQKTYQKKIKDIILKHFFEEKDLKIKIYTCYSQTLEQLILEHREPRIYILDIELDGIVNGIQIAKKIREKDWESFIIFVTNHKEMFECVYRNVYEVFSFIEKYDNLEKRLVKDLRLILNRNLDHKLFTYQNNVVFVQKYLKDITYIDRDTVERKLVIHMSDKSITKINISLKEMMKKLDKRFIQVHKSCIVNKDQVTLFDFPKSRFILHNKEIVTTLSRTYKNGILTKECSKTTNRE